MKSAIYLSTDDVINFYEKTLNFIVVINSTNPLFVLF